MSTCTCEKQDQYANCCRARRYEEEAARLKREIIAERDRAHGAHARECAAVVERDSERERAKHAESEKYAPLWSVVESLGLGANGCPDALILNAVREERLRAAHAEEEAKAREAALVNDRSKRDVRIARLEESLRLAEESMLAFGCCDKALAAVRKALGKLEEKS